MAAIFRQPFRGKIDKHGRLIIPAELRHQIGMEPGEAVTLWVNDDELRVMTIDAGIRRAQAIAAKRTKGRTGLVDDFLRERRADSGE